MKYLDQIIAFTMKAFRILETASPPTFYLPGEDVDWSMLISGHGSSECEWKGVAKYWQLVGKPQLGPVAWGYPHPKSPYEMINGYISFYPALVACFVDMERVRPQPGTFYGGWVTDEIVGPFKGEPGSEFW